MGPYLWFHAAAIKVATALTWEALPQALPKTRAKIVSTCLVW
jgi:hypothetical protein